MTNSNLPPVVKIVIRMVKPLVSLLDSGTTGGVTSGIVTGTVRELHSFKLLRSSSIQGEK